MSNGGPLGNFFHLFVFPMERFPFYCVRHWLRQSFCLVHTLLSLPLNYTMLSPPAQSMPVLVIPPLTESPLRMQDHSVEKGKAAAQSPPDPDAMDQDEVSLPGLKSQPPMPLLEDAAAAALVRPTSARSLVRQSSRSFVARKRDLPTVVHGSSANPIIAPTDLDCYVRVGMAAASPGETAQQARTRHNENETHIATFLDALERSSAAQDRLHRERLEELLLLVKEIQSTNLVDNPVIKQLHAAVVEDRTRITDLVGAVQRVEKDITDRNVNSYPLPPIPSIPPSSPYVPTRPLDDPPLPAPKRLRTSGQQYVDVLYGPVDSEGDPTMIANAAMDLIRGLHPTDIYSARYAPGQQGVISIRFRDHAKADRFMSAIDEKPLLQGQTAIPAGDSTTGRAGLGNRQPSAPTPLDIIRGVGKSARRR